MALHTHQPLAFALAAWLLLLPVDSVHSQLLIDIDKPPFNYSQTEASNRVSRLVDDLASEKRSLKYTASHGYLKSLLAALEISESSQTLVFSKTSLQVRFITRSNPRAIYFNDDTYVGWVRGSSLVEVSTVDPKLGAAFYLLEMDPQKPVLRKSTFDCLGCHSTAMTQGVPGHVVRSVYPTYDGKIHPQKKSFVTDDRSPFSERWGGWYVTGSHGDMRHMGNAFVRGEDIDTRNNGNRTDLKNDFDTSRYLAPYSDIVALMVLEHQSQMHNALTRAEFAMRQLQYEQDQAGNPPVNKDELHQQIRAIAKPVVEQLLFSNEYRLTSPVSGREDFAKTFAGRGPVDSQGRSLRDFDLKTRLFKYPCSYLIYSDAFDSINPIVRNEIYAQLIQVLTAGGSDDAYAHLDRATKDSILQILRETKPELSASTRQIRD